MSAKRLLALRWLWPDTRLLKSCGLLYPARQTGGTLRKWFGRLSGALLALVLTSGLAAAQTRITVAVGGGSCLCSVDDASGF
jgi:hypothetical protein